MNTTRSKLLQEVKPLQENKFQVLCRGSVMCLVKKKPKTKPKTKTKTNSQKTNTQEKTFAINNSNAQVKKRATRQCRGHD